MTFGSPQYLREVELRTEVLRRPLGLEFSPAELQAEVADLHFGAFRGDELLGCLLLRRVDNSVVKMRQVAVAARSRGLGIGRRLVEASEQKAREIGYAEMQLHARETATQFYLSLGYEIFGDPLTEVGLLHRKMRKRLD